MKNVHAVLFEGPLDADSMKKIADYGHEGAGTPSIVDALAPEAAEKINRCLAHLVRSTSTGVELMRPVKRHFLEVYVRGARPWMAFFAIWSAYVKAKGWTHSMDMEAYQIATRLGKKIHFLETIKEQLKALEGIPFDGIVRCLNQIDLWERHAERFVKLFLEGNLSDTLCYTLRFPSRCESVIDERDPILFERMKPFFEEGRALAFVGIAHVPGILRRFEDDGYTVTQEVL